MKAHGDIEVVNLSTGERWQRVTGDGESVLIPIHRGPIDEVRFGPRDEYPSQQQIDAGVAAILKEVARRRAEKHMAIKMRAKLTIESVTLHEHTEQVKLRAIYSDHPDENTFASATPNAEASFNISNKALHGQFKPGQKFYVDFTQVE